MIWCRFESAGVTSHGIVEGKVVTAIDGVPWGQHTVTQKTFDLANVKLLVPVIPPTFYCAGANYADHINKRAVIKGVTPKFWPKPEVGYRANSALIATEEDIVKPEGAGDEFEYEGELVAVIGKKGKHIRREDALEYVFGWTIGNDVSERAWQTGDRSNYRGKNSDTFKPMGPWIVTGLDPKNLTTTIRMNGEITDTFATGNMLWDAGACIEELSKTITLYPGDIIWLGTDGLPRSMVPGDIVEVEITGIGTLRNRVVAEVPAKLGANA